MLKNSIDTLLDFKHLEGVRRSKCCKQPLLFWMHIRGSQKDDIWPQPFQKVASILQLVEISYRVYYTLAVKTLSLTPALQYLMLMIWRACDLNFVMISSLASKCQNFKLRGLQFHFIKQLKKECPKFRALPFWIQWSYYDKIWITSTSCHKNQISKSWWEWQPSLPPSLIPALCNIGILLHTGHPSQTLLARVYT